MNDTDKLRSITATLRVLFVEDEEIFRLTVEKKLKGFFRELVLAKDGVEGLEKFGDSPFDLIITDNLMPNLNGLDMIQEIRKTDTKTPIILVTGFIDTDFLIRAINLGVTQFVAKPINFDNLYKAIEIATQRVIVENLERKTQEQELELLKYREKYHSLQQERAFRKELNIIKNDLYLRSITLDDKRDGQSIEWLCSIFFKPLDIMSGDSYSIRQIGHCRYLILLVDAMGKGLSASVTTILTTSYINHLVSLACRDGNFSLKDCIDKYLQFIREELLEDEIVCLSFVDVDFVGGKMRYAMFSEPPILLQETIGQQPVIKKILSNNQPVMKYPMPYRIDEVDISSVDKMLFYSDGLNECFSKDKNLYEEFLSKDFTDCHFAKELFEHFQKVMDDPNDDITIVFLTKLNNLTLLFEKKVTTKGRMKEINLAAESINSCIQKFISKEDAFVFMGAFTELLFNAYEHGCIDLDPLTKRRLIAQDNYDEYLLEQEAKTEKNIHITIRLYDMSGNRMVYATITDEGKGFDTNILRECGIKYTQFSGRGVRIAQSAVDSIYYNEVGNSVTLIKKAKKVGG